MKKTIFAATFLFMTIILSSCQGNKNENPIKSEPILETPSVAETKKSEEPKTETTPTKKNELPKKDFSKIELPSIQVSSESINTEGKLLTVCAANKEPNEPIGENLSPEVSFDKFDGANYYIVVMYDTDANWLHFITEPLTENSIAQGAYTDNKIYIGPYPPKPTKVHNYKIEVFALKEIPDEINARLNAVNIYNNILNTLDIANGEQGNILARGHVVGTYAHADDNQK